MGFLIQNFRNRLGHRSQAMLVNHRPQNTVNLSACTEGQTRTYAPDRQATCPKKKDEPLRPSSFSHSPITLVFLPLIGGVSKGAHRGYTHSPTRWPLKPSGLPIRFNIAFHVKRGKQPISQDSHSYLREACPHANWHSQMSSASLQILAPENSEVDPRTSVNLSQRPLCT